MQTRVPVSDGLSLLVDVTGDDSAPPLILSNSLGTDHTMWDRQVATMAQRFRVVRYDTRGHGRSDTPAGPSSIARLGQDVLDIADHFGWSDFEFGGLSLGAMTGFWLVQQAPERVRRLLLSSGSPFAGGPAAWQQRIADVEQGGLIAIEDIVLSRWFTPSFQQTHADVVDVFRTAYRAGSAEGYVSCCHAVATMDLRPGLSAIAAPVLLIAGKQDVAPAPAALAAVQAQIAGSRLLELEAAHISNVEAADEFTRAMADFFA